MPVRTNDQESKMDKASQRQAEEGLRLWPLPTWAYVCVHDHLSGWLRAWALYWLSLWYAQSTNQSGWKFSLSSLCHKKKRASRKQVCTPRQTSQWISLPCIPLELIQPFLGGLLSCACYPELCSLQSFFFKLLSIILPCKLALLTFCEFHS